MIDTASKKTRHSAQDTSVAVKSGADDTPRAGGDAVPPVPAAPPKPKEPRIERIARRAHEIYAARGGEHGRALDDWLQAEREIDAEDEQ